MKLDSQFGSMFDSVGTCIKEQCIMEITEVRIKLMEDSDDRLQAFCSITFDDCFVIRDLKIIDGTNGPFVAMPSRKLSLHCPSCKSKNHLRANFCNQCGKRQPSDRSSRDHDGRAKLYADIAHPINSECRELIQNQVIDEFQSELERAKDPSYVSRYDDDYDELTEAQHGETESGRKASANQGQGSRKRSDERVREGTATGQTSPPAVEIPGRLDVSHERKRVRDEPDSPVSAEATPEQRQDERGGRSEESERSGQSDDSGSSGRGGHKTLKGPHKAQDAVTSRVPRKQVEKKKSMDRNEEREGGGFGAGIFD